MAKRWLACGFVFVTGVVSLQAQTAPEANSAPIVLTLKRTIDLALQNSKDIQLAKIQAHVADQSARLIKAEFLPNLYAGSGAGYTYGLPETPGGRPPEIFSLLYTQDIFNGPKVSFGPNIRQGANSSFLAVVKGGRWTRVTEPLSF